MSDQHKKIILPKIEITISPIQIFELVKIALASIKMKNSTRSIAEIITFLWQITCSKLTKKSLKQRLCALLETFSY